MAGPAGRAGGSRDYRRLADWFRSQSYPSPFRDSHSHTAILPRNKDRIGRSLGSFVERNFLVPEVILPKLRQADLTGKLATWLALPQTAPMIADWIITVLKRLLAAGHSAQITSSFSTLSANSCGRSSGAAAGSRDRDSYDQRRKRRFILKGRRDGRELDRGKQTSSTRWWNNAAAGGFLERSIAALRLPLWMARSISCAPSAARQRGSPAVTGRARQYGRRSDDVSRTARQNQTPEKLLLDDTEVRASIDPLGTAFRIGLMLELSDPQSNARAAFHSAVLAIAYRCRRMHSSKQG